MPPRKQANRVEAKVTNLEWKLVCYQGNQLEDEAKKLDLEEEQDMDESINQADMDDGFEQPRDEAEDEHVACESAEQSRVESSASSSDFVSTLDDAMWATSVHQNDVHAQVQKSLEACAEVIECKSRVKGMLFEQKISQKDSDSDEEVDDAILNEIAMDACFSPTVKQKSMSAIQNAAELVKWVENDLLREANEEGIVPADSPSARVDLMPRFGLTMKTIQHVEWFVRKWGVQTFPMRVNPGGNTSRRLYVCRNATCSIWGGREFWKKQSKTDAPSSSKDDADPNQSQRRNTKSQRAEGDKELLDMMMEGEKNNKCCALMLFQKCDARKLVTGSYAE